jgi:hypothetical protein
MPTLLETNLYRTWLAKQTAKGVPIATTSMTKSPKLVAGSMVTNVDSQTENYSDGTQFGDSLTLLNSISGSGQPGLQADTDVLAYLLWLFHGTESVSPAGTNNVQTLTMSGTPTGGTTTLTYDGRTTGTIAYNAAAAAVQTALEALPNIGTGGVTCGGGPWPATPITVTFAGTGASGFPVTQKRPHPLITSPASGASGNLLTGGTSPQAASAQTTPGVNATHTFQPTGTPGFWLTWCQSLGTSTTWKQKFNDTRIGAITIEASTGSKALRITPSLLSGDPAEIYTTDPTPAISTAPVMNFTEGAGGYVIDGVAFTGQTQFQITLDLGLAFVYGDNVTPHDMARGNAAATIAATVLMDDVMKAQWNTWVYGSASPSAGTKPLSRVPPVGSYACTLSKTTSGGTHGSFTANFPGIQWEIPDSPGPSPDSGSAEVSLAGRLSRLAGQQPYTLTVGNQQAAYTV